MGMCQFHSFLWQCESGEIFDQPGEVHHSAIAETCGVSQDRFLLPEFHLAERRLDFDGKGWADVYGTNPRDRLDAYNWLNRTHGWTNKGLDKLNRYLVKHFGTADALMEFVEPQWEQAQRSCIETLKKGVWVPAEPQKSGLPELRLDSKTKDWKVDHRRDMIDATTSTTGIPFRQYIAGPLEVDIRCQLGAIDGIDLLQGEFELVMCLDGQEVRSGALGVRCVELVDNGIVHIAALQVTSSLPPPRIEYDEWKELFREARNRVECWQEDRVEMLV
ncbi:MAG: hypothetical protein WC565_09540 [Parcubacteria group bacterium]|jgi:hypothetical protein